MGIDSKRPERKKRSHASSYLRGDAGLPPDHKDRKSSHSAGNNVHRRRHGKAPLPAGQSSGGKVWAVILLLLLAGMIWVIRFADIGSLL